MYHIQAMEYLVIKRNEGICLTALLKARRLISSATRATCKNSAKVPDLTISAQTSMVSPGNTTSRHTTSFSFIHKGYSYNVDEVWKHYSKSKKSVTRDHILYNSIGEGKYRKLSKKKIESLWEKKYFQSGKFLKQ